MLKHLIVYSSLFYLHIVYSTFYFIIYICPYILIVSVLYAGIMT